MINYGSTVYCWTWSTTTQAEGLASGLGSFQPFLTEAAAITKDAAKDLVSPTAYQDYMSPFQQDVIDTTLQSLMHKLQEVYQRYQQEQFNLQELLVVDEKELKEQFFKQSQIEIEQHYKHNYYNKDLHKHKI